MNVIRKKYIEDLKIRMHNGMIKVITGIRRSGKSYLLFNLFYNYLIDSGICKDNIIKIALDDDKNENFRNSDELSSFIRSKIKNDSENYYVFLDEIQFAISLEESKNPEKSIKIFSVLNGLLQIPNVDVYVTGSNSRFLSKDVLTEFRGRGDEIHILPFTFSEFMQGYDGDIYHGWAEYIVYGGLPATVSMQSDEQKANYLINLFKETYIKDIIEKNRISKTQELEDLINILASSTGSLTNPTKIHKTFLSVLHSKISINTLLNYFDYLEDAFVISSVNRYDVKSRKYIGSQKKYYFEDIGLRNARLNFRQIEQSHLMENIIYNELRFRGFNVDVGIIEKRIIDADGKNRRNHYEIDFVANKGSARYYIQSAFEISNSEKEIQEKFSLKNVDDSFKKIIIVKDVIKPYYDDDGIKTIGLFDFLLDPKSLEQA